MRSTERVKRGIVGGVEIVSPSRFSKFLGKWLSHVTRLRPLAPNKFVNTFPKPYIYSITPLVGIDLSTLRKTHLTTFTTPVFRIPARSRC